MKDTKMQNKTKQLLAWILSLQIAGVVNIVPAFTLLSSLMMLPQVYAGEDVKPVAPPPKPKGEGEKLDNAPYFEGGHGGTVVEQQPAKKRFCRDENGKWKSGCTLAFVLLGIAAIVALIALTKNKSKCTSCSGKPRRPPGRPDRPNRPERPERPTERPPRVPCCQNPAPAPAPSGGGTNQTSNVTTGNSPVPGVEPIVVNP